MADIKRVKYFDQQLLVLADFTDEQDYHKEMRRRHNQALHTFGVGDGLVVTRTTTDNKKLTISPGTAIDNLGREMVIATGEGELPLNDSTKYPASKSYIVYIAYQEKGEGTRTTERPEVDAKPDSAVPSDGSVVRLASISLDAGGNINNLIDLSVRQTAGARGITGLKTLEGVPGDPAGNIDLVGTPVIQISPDVGGRKITISETHSSLGLDKAHRFDDTILRQGMGLLLAKDYDLRQRQIISVPFKQDAATPITSPSTKSIPLSFLPKVLFAVGSCTVIFQSDRTYGGTTFGFDTLTNGISNGAANSGLKVVRHALGDWVYQGNFSGDLFNASFQDEVLKREVTLRVKFASFDGGTGKIFFEFSKTPPPPAVGRTEILDWIITLQVLCLG